MAKKTNTDLIGNESLGQISDLPEIEEPIIAPDVFDKPLVKI